MEMTRDDFLPISKEVTRVPDVTSALRVERISGGTCSNILAISSFIVTSAKKDFPIPQHIENICEITKV